MKLSRRILVLLVATLIAVMLAAGPALAAPGNNGKGAANANPKASSGINNAIIKSGGGCGLC